MQAGIAFHNANMSQVRGIRAAHGRFACAHWPVMALCLCVCCTCVPDVLAGWLVAQRALEAFEDAEGVWREAMCVPQGVSRACASLTVMSALLCPVHSLAAVSGTISARTSGAVKFRYLPRGSFSCDSSWALHTYLAMLTTWP